MSKILVEIGNDLSNNPPNIQENIQKIAKYLINLVQQNNELIITYSHNFQTEAINNYLQQELINELKHQDLISLVKQTLTDENDLEFLISTGSFISSKQITLIEIENVFMASKIAQLIDTEKFIILTNHEYLYLNFNQPNQIELRDMNAKKVEFYLDNPSFAEGTMKPKVEAALRFVKHTNGYQNYAFIGSFHKLNEILNGKSGTKITK